MKLGQEMLAVNALHGVRYLHEGERDAAYEDRERRPRISPYALLREPQRVLRELMRLSRGRWTKEDAVSAVRQAHQHVSARLARV